MEFIIFLQIITLHNRLEVVKNRQSITGTDQGIRINSVIFPHYFELKLKVYNLLCNTTR